MTRSSAAVVFAISVLFLITVAFSLRPLMFALSVEGEYRSQEKLESIFIAKQSTFEQLVALCGDQPKVRSARISSELHETFGGTARVEVADEAERMRRLLNQIDAYSIWCDWDFSESIPQFQRAFIGFYFEENQQGTHEQQVAYFAPQHGPETLKYLDGSITLTKLPAQGWYIWEQGIGHEAAAP